MVAIILYCSIIILRGTFHFVCNNNVTRAYMWRDGIHLNNDDTGIFAGNLVNYLNNFIFRKDILTLKFRNIYKDPSFLSELNIKNVNMLMTGNLNINSISSKSD